MTELEKCNAGLPYRFDDPEMVARKTRAIRACERFNAIDGTDYSAQYEQLKEMLGSVGERVWIAKSFNCDCGMNIHVGNDFTGNHNLTILDIREVRIGDNAVIGAGSVVTEDIPAGSLAVGAPARVIRQLKTLRE